MHAAEFSLNKEAAQHRVVEDIEDREDKLGQVGDKDVGKEPRRVSTRQSQYDVSVRSQSAKAEAPEGGQTSVEISVLECLKGYSK